MSQKSNPENLQKLRHSLAHLLAAAVMELWPQTKRAIGPAIESGFYYDFDFEKPITEKDLTKIEKKMREILPTWKEFERHELSAKDAKAEYPNNPYKHELIGEFSEGGKKKVSFYKSGNYWDLCRGGHVENPAKDINPKAFKLTHVAGAYWRGDEKNKMLTRIYGAAFATQEELDKYLIMMEEAKKRDHKKLGRELDLFTFSDLVGTGLPLWTPKGMIIRNLLDDYVWQLRRVRGYVKVDIPHITKKDLFETSGHWDKFKDELFKITTREGHLFALKPMNCPFHTQIYARKKFSYRELPQRYANTTAMYRDEQTGELSGLARVRSINIDDAHVFCRFTQIEDEMNTIWDIIDSFYPKCGFKINHVRLSLHDPKEPEKYLGEESTWQKAEESLRKLAKKRKVKTMEVAGEAAFYGPKIDFIAHDSLGREWQLATIQLDMNMPERFNLTCTNEKGEDERIVMIHAAIMGSAERFMSVLIEHFAGAFPLWLSPVQVKVLTISDEVKDYAGKITQQLEDQEIRVELDERSESISKKIREAEKEKIPYMLVIGKKEQAEKKVAVRQRGEKDLGVMELEKFISKTQGEIKKKSV